MLSPTLGLLIYLFLIMLLLYFEPTDEGAIAPALWLPTIWFLIVASRLPSQWFSLSSTLSIAAYEDGSPLDRIIYLLLILLGICTLVARRIQLPEIIKRNSVLTIFLFYALVSTAWSDYPFITFKRWIRDIGLYLMVMVVLSDVCPVNAISTVLRRVTYIVIPLSVALIKYFPGIGVSYDPFFGLPYYQGAALSKNMLGIICLISGLFYFWDMLWRWPDRKNNRTRKILLVDTLMTTMTLWLMYISESATSKGCLAIGYFIILVFNSKWARANQLRLLRGIITCLFAFVFLYYLFDLQTLAAQFFDRDPTMTGRTGIWDAVIVSQKNPLLGAGYQSFWIGERILEVQRRLDSWFPFNQAHNGYIEIYLNLGIIGLTLLAAFMLASCRTLWRQFQHSPHMASLGLSVWLITLIHNITEAGYFINFIWSALLLFVMVVPPIKSTTSQEQIKVGARKVFKK
jgi:exopolysaccharide production protein ExoQ